MKKISTKLLIIATICLIASVTFIFLSIQSEMDFPAMEQFKEEYNEIKEDDPGIGWFLLFGGGMALFTDFVLILLYIAILLIPNVILITILILQSIARLIQIGEQKDWKDTTSKVLTIISIILQILFCIYFLLIILVGLLLGEVLLALMAVLVINIISIVLFIKELKRFKKTDVDTHISKDTIKEI